MTTTDTISALIVRNKELDNLLESAYRLGESTARDLEAALRLLGSSTKYRVGEQLENAAWDTQGLALRGERADTLLAAAEIVIQQLQAQINHACEPDWFRAERDEADEMIEEIIEFRKEIQ